MPATLPPYRDAALGHVLADWMRSQLCASSGGARFNLNHGYSCSR